MFTADYVRMEFDFIGMGTITRTDGETVEGLELYAADEVALVAVREYAQLIGEEPRREVLFFPMASILQATITSGVHPLEESDSE